MVGQCVWASSQAPQSAAIVSHCVHLCGPEGKYLSPQQSWAEHKKHAAGRSWLACGLFSWQNPFWLDCSVSKLEDFDRCSSMYYVLMFEVCFIVSLVPRSICTVGIVRCSFKRT